MMVKRVGLIAAVMIISALAGTGLFFATQADAELVADKPENRLPAASSTVANERNTEQTVLDRWTLTCRTDAQGEGNKKCSATNRIVDQNTGNALFVWVIGRNNQGDMVAYFQTPTGVLIGQGLTLTLANLESQKIDFYSCDNRRCEAILPLTEALVEEIADLPHLTAKIVSTTGYDLVFKIENNGISDVLHAF